eukprot:scpid66177/ scgid31546/ 
MIGLPVLGGSVGEQMKDASVSAGTNTVRVGSLREHNVRWSVNSSKSHAVVVPFDMCDVVPAHPNNIYCTSDNLMTHFVCLSLTTSLLGVKMVMMVPAKRKKENFIPYLLATLLMPKFAYLQSRRCKGVLPTKNITIRDAGKHIARNILSICPRGSEVRHSHTGSHISTTPAPQPKGFPDDNCLYRLGSDVLFTVLLTPLKHLILAGSRIYDVLDSKGNVRFGVHGHSIPLACWETDLLAAEKLFYQPLQWNVDADCIAVLQSTITHILRAVSKMAATFYGFDATFGPEKLTFNYYEFGPKILAFIDSLLSIARQLDPANSDYFLQRWFYPMFNRLLLRSRQSRANNITSSEAPSCKGLRGSPDQVQKTVIKLTSMLMINELRHHKYSFVAHAFISVANQLFMSYLRLCPITISLDV